VRRQLEGEFRQNAGRVENLISAYRELETHNIGQPQTRADVLRAAVVLMHSTLEEIVRNLYVSLLPSGSVDSLNAIPFVAYGPSNRARQILLGDLQQFQGQFVENIIRDSVDAFVDTMNLNNTVQLCSCLKMVDISPATLRSTFPQLDGLMKRRHQIVHQMDRNNELDPLDFPVTDIELGVVLTWQDALGEFFLELVTLLPEENDTEVS
jgi:hypothetical protein